MPPGCASRARDLRKRRRRRAGTCLVPGPGCGSRITRRPPRDSAATASAAAGSSRPARNLTPMTLATELNPHEAVPVGLPVEQISGGAFPHMGRELVGTAVGKGQSRWPRCLRSAAPTMLS